MSLNGLDATEVNEAYQSALGEGGGWFLLKYSTRDEVELLKRGGGGVVDIRESISQSDESSPLYGFVHYRRRKVILKFVPEGTSRLLQARVTVHFQSITEKFTPHDAIFSFHTARGLNDVALSSACSLHTAAASIKSSSDSLRQRGLSEIVEDVSEYQPPEATVEPVSHEESPIGSQSLETRPERTDSLSNAQPSAAIQVDRSESSRSPQRKTGNTDKALPPTPGGSAEEKATTRNALEDTLLDARQSVEGRPSMQSIRPSIRSLHTSYDYRPKIKLGPRPSMESPNGLHNSDKMIDVRPISTLPSGVRLSTKKHIPGRPKSANGRAPIAEKTPDPLPSPKPSIQTIVPARTPVSSAVPKQLQMPEHKPSAMTPEKRRLKKALELRQRQLAARNAQQDSEQQGSFLAHQPELSLGDAKRESLTATLPDVAPGDDGNTDILQERINAFDSAPDIVHVGPQDVSKDMRENYEVSPISIPEASDGPSTQASSISDEDETPTKTESATAPTNFKPTEDETSMLRLEHKAQSYKDRDVSNSSAEQSITELPRANMGMTEDVDTIKNDLTILGPLVGQRVSEEHVHDQEEACEASLNTDPSKPLDTKELGSSKSISTASDPVKPHGVPLPPIDKDEEISLSPLRKVFLERSASRPRLEDGECFSQNPDQAQHLKEKSLETRPPTIDPTTEQRERRIKRHGLINPIKRVSSPDYSDDQFLSDDSFMEELTSATVQEAKPISVSKSPIMPVFPRSVSESKSTDELRPTSAGSRLMRPKRLDDQPMMPKLPDLFSARSASATHAPLFEAQLSPPTSKKIGVSSGISQRIKALEQLSSRPTSPASQLSSPPAAPGSRSTSTDRRKTSFRASQAAAEIARASTQSSKARPPVPFSPTPTSMDRNLERANDSVVRIDVATKPGKARPESISVTARIVRGSKNQVPELSQDLSQPKNLDLYPSPLIVEHQSMQPTSPPSPLKPPKPSYARSMSSMSGGQKSDPMPTPRRDSISSRLSSTPSRRGSEPELPRTMSDSSINSITNLDGTKEEKRESRKSRLFKRMSNISAASRRSIASALSPVRKDIKEEPIVEHNEPSRETLRPLAVEVGDVNIQFPDTLLWKRRHMRINEQGLLVLSASKADTNSKVIPKRYPLTEFLPPYLPDQDQQELPNSVILDFRDGSTLQCACENPYTQHQVFRTLRQAHQTYNIAS